MGVSWVIPRVCFRETCQANRLKHTSNASQNKCGFAKVGAYFQTGQLPGNDSFCALEAGPFGVVLNGTLKQNILQAGLSNLVH